jgi:HAD superfamily hydrolase (TIGR01509 family)
MQIKAILFDIDGTLVDSNDAHILAWQEAFSGKGMNFDRGIIKEQMGKGADMLLPTLVPELDEQAHSDLTTAQGDSFSRYRGDVRPFPDARSLISHAHGLGQKIVLASSASKDDLDHYLDLIDIRDLVMVATTSDDVEKTKPAPDIFSTALGKLPGLSPADVLVVGDTPYDIEAAKKCGIGSVAVRSGGFSDKALYDAGAIAIYDDVADLLSDYSRSPLGQ